MSEQNNKVSQVKQGKDFAKPLLNFCHFLAPCLKQECLYFYFIGFIVFILWYFVLFFLNWLLDILGFSYPWSLWNVYKCSRTMSTVLAVHYISTEINILLYVNLPRYFVLLLCVFKQSYILFQTFDHNVKLYLSLLHIEIILHLYSPHPYFCTLEYFYITLYKIYFSPCIFIFSSGQFHKPHMIGTVYCQ